MKNVYTYNMKNDVLRIEKEISYKQEAQSAVKSRYCDEQNLKTLALTEFTGGGG